MFCLHHARFELHCVRFRCQLHDLVLQGFVHVPLIIGGIFKVEVDGLVIWDRKVEGRFPDSKEVKDLVRKVLAPDKNLGHIDRSLTNS